MVVLHTNLKRHQMFIIHTIDDVLDILFNKYGFQG